MPKVRARGCGTGMTRREFLRWSAGAATALALPRRSSAAPAPPRAAPNIVVVLFDDLGYGEPPCYRGDSPFPMPSLDRLAREGMLFTDAHCAASVCTPSRYGLLTGRSPFRAGQFGVLGFASRPVIPAERLTVGALLRARGYHTACFGKWHLGMDWGAVASPEAATPGTPVANGPITRGFDVFCGYTEAHSMGTLVEQERVLGRFEPSAVQPLLADRAVRYLEGRAGGGRPFFLYLPLAPPHRPYVPAPEFAGRSGQGPYGDWIFQGDATTGRILETLERTGLAGNTLVLVSSDNGAEGRSYPPLRGVKRTIWEGGHRVPLLARWPGRIRPGALCRETVSLNDLVATCADILGERLPDGAGEDSVSILPLLLGAAAGPVREATVHQSLRGDLAIRQGPWKLVFLARGGRLLFNLAEDLGETRDVLASNPAPAERLAALLQRYLDAGRSTPGAPQKNDVPLALPGTAAGPRRPRPRSGRRRRRQPR